MPQVLGCFPKSDNLRMSGRIICRLSEVVTTPDDASIGDHDCPDGHLTSFGCCRGELEAYAHPVIIVFEIGHLSHL